MTLNLLRGQTYRLLLSMLLTLVCHSAAFASSSNRCESAFKEFGLAESLSSRLLAQAEENPFSISYRATVLIDDAFSTALRKKRELTDRFLEDSADIAGEKEIFETNAAALKVRETNDRIQKVIRPSAFKRMLSGWRAMDISEQVLSLSKEIQDCHAHAKVCSARIQAKIAQLENHIRQVQNVAAELKTMRDQLDLAKATISTKVDHVQAKEDIIEAIEAKTEALNLELTALEQHLGLVRVKIRTATLSHRGTTDLDTIVEAAKNLGRPYADRKKSDVERIQLLANEDLLSLQDQELLKAFENSAPDIKDRLKHRRELRALATISNYRATNVILEAFAASWQTSDITSKQIRDFKFLMTGRQLVPQNASALKTFLYRGIRAEFFKKLITETTLAKALDTQTTATLITVFHGFVTDGKFDEIFADREIDGSHVALLESAFFNEQLYDNTVYTEIGLFHDRERVLKLIGKSQNSRAKAFLTHIASGDWVYISKELDERGAKLSVQNYAAQVRHEILSNRQKQLQRNERELRSLAAQLAAVL